MSKAEIIGVNTSTYHIVAELNGQDPFSLPFLHRFYYQTLAHGDLQ